MIPSTTRFLISCLACLVMGLAQQPVQAQTLGGLPDLTFNVGDSGLSAPRIHHSNQIFFPGPEAGVYVSWKYNLYGANYNVPYKFASSNFYSKNGEIESLQKGLPDYQYEQSGAVISPSDNVYFTISNKSDYVSNSTFGLDSIVVSSLKPSNRSRKFNLANGFYFNKPFWGNYHTGIVKQSSSKMTVWLTHSSIDTAYPHNQTFVKLLDDTCKPLAPGVEIPYFRALLSSTYQGNIYLLGNTILGDSTVGAFRIIVLDGNNLQILTNTLPAFDPNVVHRPDVFRVLPDGKMLLAGRLQTSTLFSDIVEQAIRLNPDGSLDNTGNDELLGILQALTQGNNVFVISHKTDAYLDKFEKVLKFEKHKNFSRIAEV